jgi:hypothetical protein
MRDPDQRIPYALRDRDLLRRIMQNPGRGTPYTVRSLAQAADCTSSIIDHLRSGRQKTVPVHQAHAIAEALGVAVLVLFAPPASPNHDGTSKTTDTT